MPDDRKRGARWPIERVSIEPLIRPCRAWLERLACRLERLLGGSHGHE